LVFPHCLQGVWKKCPKKAGILLFSLQEFSLGRQ